MRKILSIFVLLFSVLRVSADAGGFYYKDFRFEAVVHADNTWYVKETIVADFQEPRHGIYRYIPQKFSLNHKVNGETLSFNYSPSIGDISVLSYDYETSEDGNNKVIKIGSEDNTVLGEQTYVITYTFKYLDDRITDKDYLFHTILGTDFNENIEHFSFNISFDKTLPASVRNELQVFGGNYGDTSTIDDIDMNVAGNTISGEAFDIAPNHGITLYCNLPEGYYEGVETVSETPMMICFYITMALVAIILFIALTRRQPHITKQIEFYPPEGISSAEVGTIIDGQVDPVDLASLIPWFASKGYLKISEIEEKALFGKKTVLKLHKIKGIPQSAPAYQQHFASALLGNNSEVRLDELDEQPEKMKNAKESIDALYAGKEGADDDRSLMHTNKWIWLYLPLLIVSTLTIVLSSKVASFDDETFYVSISTWVLPLLFIGFIYYYLKKGEKVRSSVTKWSIHICMAIAIAAGYGVARWMVVDNDHFMDDTMFLVFFAGCIAAFLLTGKFIVDTPFRAKMMGKLLGLKEFIQTAEKPRLESLLEDDPEYFYKIMPYAMVFGLTDKWSKQFENIKMDQPDWYQGSSLNTYYFAHSMNTLCSSATSAITTVSHDSSSSGGGGFAGGGGGGGGGGSW